MDATPSVVSFRMIWRQLMTLTNLPTDIVVNDGIVSNRHCLIFTENKGNDTVAIVEDLSSNGTYVNEAIVGRNQRRELEEQDEIAVHGKARFVFLPWAASPKSTLSRSVAVRSSKGRWMQCPHYLVT